MKERNFTIRLFSCSLLVISAVLFNGCGGETSVQQDTRDSGTVHISVDESFQPVIDSHIRVFESRYPKTKIIAHYKPEADCFRDFAVDSIRMIIATRGFSKKEEAFMVDSLQVDPSHMVIANDAIALIIHPSSKDSLLKMQEVRDLLSGTTNSPRFPVFDGIKATSTVRFILDSVLRGQQLSNKAVAANSSLEVIDYVSRTPNAVGFIGVSWIGNPEDTTQLSYLEKVRVVQLEHPMIPGKYVTPAQFNIFYRRYPLIRELVYTLKEKQNGVAHAFADFITGQRGQLIFKRAYLMPVRLNFQVRDAHLTE